MTRQTSLSRLLRDDKGATLVELLVAIAVVSGVFLTVSSGVLLRPFSDPMEESISALRNAAAEARILAREQQRSIRLVILDRQLVLDPGEGARLQQNLSWRISPSVHVKLETALEASLSGNPALIFLPDERSSGARIELSIGPSRRVVFIDDQTSRVSVDQ